MVNECVLLGNNIAPPRKKKVLYCSSRVYCYLTGGSYWQSKRRPNPEFRQHYKAQTRLLVGTHLTMAQRITFFPLENEQAAT